MTSIPATLWEQAGIIVLFVLAAITVTRLVLKWLENREEKWQLFLTETNDKWLMFNKEQRDENNDAVNGMKQSITDLNATTAALVVRVEQFGRDQNDHHLAVRMAFDDIKTELLKRPRPPRRKPAEGVND